jgi:hypothetical protein
MLRFLRKIVYALDFILQLRFFLLPLFALKGDDVLNQDSSAQTTPTRFRLQTTIYARRNLYNGESFSLFDLTTTVEK